MSRNMFNPPKCLARDQQPLTVSAVWCDSEPSTGHNFKSGLYKQGCSHQQVIYACRHELPACLPASKLGGGSADRNSLCQSVHGDGARLPTAAGVRVVTGGSGLRLLSRFLDALVQLCQTALPIRPKGLHRAHTNK